MTDRQPLEWLDTAWGQVPDCEACRSYQRQPHMLGAAASVGISRGITTEQAARSAVEAYHRRHPIGGSP